MPSSSLVQARLMQIACAGKSKKVPKKVGCEFVKHDKAAGKYQGKK